jgi:SAM-dependent methyltransferase
MLLRLLANLGRSTPRGHVERPRFALDTAQRNVLNVGGGSRAITLPAHYAGWGQVMLDIDSRAHPDILLDARELTQLDAAVFDAVYCSHNLEHYYAHDVPKVLAGFAHVLKPDGFAEIRVPDVAAVAREIVQHGRELDDILYTSPAGPISVRDVLYGLGRMIEKTGDDFFAHKTGFTARLLAATLAAAGFAHVHVVKPVGVFEIRVIALRSPASGYHRKLLGLALDHQALAGGHLQHPG